MSDSYVSWETNNGKYIHVWNHASISTYVLVIETIATNPKGIAQSPYLLQGNKDTSTEFSTSIFKY
jgi:hypothetical protein